MEDLHAVPKTKGITIDKKVAVFFKALKSIRDSWSISQKWMANYGYDRISTMDITAREQLVDIVFATLDCVIKAAAELFDVLEDGVLSEDYSQDSTPLNQKPDAVEKLKPRGKDQIRAENTDNTECTPSTKKNTRVPVSNTNKNVEQQDNKTAETGVPKTAPQPPTKLPKEPMQSRLRPPPPPPPTLSGVSGLPKGASPQPMKLAEEPAQSRLPLPPPPPSPPMLPAKGSIPASVPLKNYPGPPLPPPPGPGKFLPKKKAITKLNRSTQMLNLFRKLKDKMEGSSLAIKSANMRKLQLGGSTGGKAGLAATLAELTKRSPYVQQIEEDVQKYKKPILELIVAINSFQTNDMVKLLKFRNNLESVLGVLTDESQVLAKFEGFPSKKLESLRAAATLYSKLDSIVTTLRTWEIVPPLVKLLDKVDCYFRKVNLGPNFHSIYSQWYLQSCLPVSFIKVKLELDAFERNKDEDSKMFKRHGIDFDFLMVIRVKESMVNLSTGCIELALKERRRAKTAKENGEFGNQKTNESVNMLWRVFQFAFRVYSFAGGQDDCADKLAKELADELLIN
ncbi:uncharacterized protein At4g04980 isoform X3 [Ricinus communis]|uniref:uncharacterized protein At4g04980 isoform X3 n=1 Tax=Ricinus communis TaxID=3988 RepID=UPI00201A487A|nr:uncharacterized protein At4g04980 isoform X3 [Ricinus communis]